MEPRDFRSLHSQAQEDIRHKTVQTVVSGISQTEAARLFGITRQAVAMWMAAYRKKGEAGLKAHRRGRPLGGKLDGRQSRSIARAIEDRCPDQLKLPFSLWTRGAVVQLIEKRYGIGISVWTVGRYLAQWGFTPQKPIRRAFEQDPEAVRQWMEAEYPRIRKEAKRMKAEIYWGDEMGLRADHTVGRSYSRRGNKPVIPGTGRRFGCNMISAITNRGGLTFMVFKQSFNYTVFLEFLNRLVRQINRPMILIIDGHPVHTSGVIKKWANQHRRHFRIYYLPGYSPELNPDELLNQDVKTNSVGRCRPHTQKEMIGTVRRYLRSRQRLPAIVRGYFSEKHVSYAAL